MQVILTGGNRGIGAQMTSQLRARGDTVRRNLARRQHRCGS